MTIQEALQKKVWAVLGATDKTHKFGYKIYAHMKAAGYEVYPVNPRVETIDGQVCYNSLTDLPVKPDVVDFVVPESAGLAALDECLELGIQTVWLQPGADTDAVVKKANDLGLAVIQDCVLVQVK
ncbi:MAG: CoA-binding protein [Veillonella sp.]|nr:CoA-binding protein [Veillonella sp.]